MAQEVERLVARLAQEGEKTCDFFASLSDEELDQRVYAEGAAWRVRDLLAHLVASEAKTLLTLTDLLAGRPGLPGDFDLDSFNESEVRRLSAVPPSSLLERLRSDRRALVAMVAGLRDSDLDLPGRHPWLGETPFGEMLQLVYRHAMLHRRDIRRAMESGEPVPASGARPRVAARGQENPTRKEDLVLFLKTCHAQSWPSLQEFARDHSQVVVYPEEPKWRVREVLAHLADAEQGLLGQARRVARGERALPEGFDLARWNRHAVEKRAAKSPQEHLREIEAGFRQWIDFVASLEEKTLEARGIDAEGLPLTVEGFARRAAQHRLDHAGDMDRAIRSSL